MQLWVLFARDIVAAQPLVSILLVGSDPGKIQIQGCSYEIVLPIGLLAGIVLVLVVDVELDMLAHRKQATCIEVGRAPFLVFALVKRFGCNVRNQVIGRNPNASLHS